MARPGPALAAMVSMVVLVVAASASAQPAPAPTASEAMRLGTCGACHEVPGQPRLSRQDSCADCHAWIRKVAASEVARAKAMELFPKWERYEHNVDSYLAVPSLEAAMARLRPQWVAAYLADPHDLRPLMPETMPRLGLSGPARRAIAGSFAEAQRPVAATPAPDAANLAAGEALFTSRGCAGCHTFGAAQPGPGLATAPDLRWARQRMEPDMAAAWIRDPRAVSPAATMPSMGLTSAEAVAVRDYLWLADPGGMEAEPLSTALPAHEGAATWVQVEARVTGKICVHCHMDPEQNEGRAGPGNAGGFGFAATGLELQTPASVCTNGEAVVNAMVRRKAEAHRDVVGPGQIPALLTRPERPGMPLGLPPIAAADIALVQAWLDGGCAE